jgi:hypothetical protein
MWNWFAPRCPLGTWEKTWTETRMCWLAERFGIDRLRGAEVILPTQEHFPDPYPPGGSWVGARQLLARLCRYMSIPSHTIELEVCPDDQMEEAAGTWQQDSGKKRGFIRIAESRLLEPQGLLATLAHELAHELLHGRGLLDDTVADHEWITDLLPVYLGIGLFAANSTLHEQTWNDGNLSWWQIRRHGYLPSRILGYGLALLAFARGEHSPAWASHLRLDASSPLKKGLAYLQKTGDSLFHPDTAGQPKKALGPDDALDRLQAQSASVRLAALWDIREAGLTAPVLLEPILKCMQDRDPDIPGDAAHTVAAFGATASSAVPVLLQALRSSNPRTRAGAAEALGEIRQQPAVVVPELCTLLNEGDRTLVLTSAQALSKYRVHIEPRALGRLLGWLETALIDCDSELGEAVVSALLMVSKDPEAAVNEYFTGRDRELRKSALRALAEMRR